MRSRLYITWGKGIFVTIVPCLFCHSKEEVILVGAISEDSGATEPSEEDDIR
jgi:hypothetical protein